MVFKQTRWETSEGLSLTKLQTMANNDEALYQEIIRRPRGVLGVANLDIFSTTAFDANSKNWQTVKSDLPDSNGVYQQLKLWVSVEADRLIKVELYIPVLEYLGPASGTIPSGFKMLRDDVELGLNTGAVRWANNARIDPKSIHMLFFDSPPEGFHEFEVQWKQEIDNCRFTIPDKIILSSATPAVEITDLGFTQLIVEDMGSSLSLDIASETLPENAVDPLSGNTLDSLRRQARNMSRKITQRKPNDFF